MSFRAVAGGLLFVCVGFFCFFVSQVVFVANLDTTEANDCKIHLMAAAFVLAHANLARELYM